MPGWHLPVSISRASAFYGEGGVRLLAIAIGSQPLRGGQRGHRASEPRHNGIGSTATDAIVRAALNFVDTSDPIFGAGGGILFHGGPLQIDLGIVTKGSSPTAC